MNWKSFRKSNGKMTEKSIKKSKNKSQKIDQTGKKWWKIKKNDEKTDRRNGKKAK